MISHVHQRFALINKKLEIRTIHLIQSGKDIRKLGFPSPRIIAFASLFEVNLFPELTIVNHYSIKVKKPAISFLSGK